MDKNFLTPRLSQEINEEKQPKLTLRERIIYGDMIQSASKTQQAVTPLSNRRGGFTAKTIDDLLFPLTNSLQATQSKNPITGSDYFTRVSRPTINFSKPANYNIINDIEVCVNTQKGDISLPNYTVDHIQDLESGFNIYCRDNTTFLGRDGERLLFRHFFENGGNSSILIVPEGRIAGVYDREGLLHYHHPELFCYYE